MTSEDNQAGPPSPFAKYTGSIDLGGTPVDCYVLDDERRVISLRSTVKALSSADHGKLGDYLSVGALKEYVDKDAVMAEAIDFAIPGALAGGKGLTAERFLDICRAYVSALRDDKLTTDTQRKIAIRCSITLAACANIGLIALIDEATGYQYDRSEDALQVKLRAFIADELRDWEKTFPDDLWEQFGRLTNWSGSLHSRPKYWGKLVMELIYEALDQDIAIHLRNHKPPPRKGENYHQWMTQDVGLRALVTHISEVVGIARTCSSMQELRKKVADAYGKQPFLLNIYAEQQKPKP